MNKCICVCVLATHGGYVLFFYAVSGPALVPKSDTVSGEKDNGLHEWSVKFDEHVSIFNIEIQGGGGH